jgi:hypothetical protein
MAAMSPPDNARRFVHRKNAWRSVRESIEAHLTNRPGPRQSGFPKRPRPTGNRGFWMARREEPTVIVADYCMHLREEVRDRLALLPTRPFMEVA